MILFNSGPICILPDGFDSKVDLLMPLLRIAYGS